MNTLPEKYTLSSRTDEKETLHLKSNNNTDVDITNKNRPPLEINITVPANKLKGNSV
jgi:hypothetical protein